MCIEQFRSPNSPWRVFQSVYATSSVCFFLDSIHYHPPDQSYSYIGADPFLELTLEKGRIHLRGAEKGSFPASDLFPVLRRLMKKYRASAVPAVPFFAGGAVGYWGYELASLFDRIHFRRKPDPGFPQLYLGFFRNLIVYDHRRKKYLLISDSKTETETLKRHFKNSEVPDRPFRLKRFKPEISRPRFEQMVRRAKEYIAAGDIYQANLSQRFSFEFSGSPVVLYGSLRKINPSPFASFLKIGGLEIISSSPERLVRKSGRLCETRPIAGTRPRRRAGQSERELARELLHNEKERAEHLMLVDLERNDLGRVCDYRSVRVREFMKIEKYSHVIHLVSKITGRIQQGKDALDLIRAMFPGGTITGCPKIRCMEIIDELEPVRRGVYTGSIGYLDFRGDLDLNIVIRTLILQKNKGYLQVGAGIVHDSVPAREFEETLAKGEAMAQALIQAGD